MSCILVLALTLISDVTSGGHFTSLGFFGCRVRGWTTSLALKLSHRAMCIRQQCLMEESRGIPKAGGHMSVYLMAIPLPTLHNKPNQHSVAYNSHYFIFAHNSMAQQFGLGSAEWFFCWSFLGSVMQLQSSSNLTRGGWSIMASLMCLVLGAGCWLGHTTPAG